MSRIIVPSPRTSARAGSQVVCQKSKRREKTRSRKRKQRRTRTRSGRNPCVDDDDEGAEDVDDESVGDKRRMGAWRSEAHLQSLEDGAEEAADDPNTEAAAVIPAASKCRMKTHRHYRLVVKEVGLPLQEFPCAHQDAYQKAGVMHRDISVGNILIMPPTSKDKESTYRGLLADWELSKRLDDYEAGARHPDRTGTWQFMSVHIQDHPEAQVQIADELESFLHVMIYCAIRYLPHTCVDVGRFMYTYFDDGERRQQESEYTCGLLKGVIMEKGALITPDRVPITFFRSAPVTDSKKSSTASKKRPSAPPPPPPPPPPPHPINHVISKLLPMFSARYRIAPDRSADPLDAFATGRFSSSFQPPLQQQQGEPIESAETHSAMLDLLNMASEEAAPLWPGREDRVADQLKPNYNPNKPNKTHEKPTKPAKRARPRDAVYGVPIKSTKRRRGDGPRA
ncbi:hypothetical protein NUW54_g9474 [Trametes sanguinea]|uniref:Uncharacterized protein n=1 Tax=Trametes sanguinea TaxID=158606 RepID=A0ACC1P7Z3_9APHY|nr:hypothetical protein NUW54_g9474 [Trametes sanguinea]